MQNHVQSKIFANFNFSRLVTQVEKLQKAEQEGMLAWQESPAVSRALRDDIDDYVEQNLRIKPKD